MALSPPRGPSEKDSSVDVLQRKRKAKFLWSKVVGTIPIHTVHLDECEPTSKTRLSTNTLEINSDELQLLRQIGSGGFGVIHKAFWRGTVVACKTIRTDMFAEEQLAALEDLHLEVQVLQQLRHPNIMMLLAYEANSEHQVQIKASSLGRHPAHNARAPRARTHSAAGVRYLVCSRRRHLQVERPARTGHRMYRPAVLHSGCSGDGLRAHGVLSAGYPQDGLRRR